MRRHICKRRSPNFPPNVTQWSERIVEAVKRDVRSGSRLCENVHEPRVPRIVFSIAFFRQKLPVQLVSTSTKSRWKFYTQVRRGSFHTAWKAGIQYPAASRFNQRRHGILVHPPSRVMTSVEGGGARSTASK